jgi:hypothetical protein
MYFYHYYGARGGGDPGADPRSRALYVLRSLDTRHSWIGRTVHNCLRWVIDTMRRDGAAPPEEEALRLLGRRLQRDFQESGEGLYWDEPGAHTGLLEHEYDERDVPDEEWQALLAKALGCVSVFYASEVLGALRGVAAGDWLEVEKLSSFDLDGTKIWVRLDCAVRAHGGIAIYDWKTGRPGLEETREQLACYILYTAQAWGVPPESVVACEFNLAAGTLHERRLEAGDAEALRAAIAASAAEMRALHGGPEDRFPFADDEAPCGSCRFTRVCARFASAPPDPL